MMIALAIWLCCMFGGSAGTKPFFEHLKHLTQFVKADISDSARRKDLLEVLERTEELRNSMDAHANQLQDKLIELARKHEAPVADFDKLLGDARKGLDSDREKLLDLRFELHDKLSRQEWTKALAEKPAK